MKQYKQLSIAGILVILIPFTGFRASWRTFLLFTVGVWILYMAYRRYLEYTAHQSKAPAPSMPTYAESIPHPSPFQETTENHVS